MRTPDSKAAACVAGALLLTLAGAPARAAADREPLRLLDGQALSFDRGGSAVAGSLFAAAPRRAAGFSPEHAGTFRLGGSFGMLLASGSTGLALRAQGTYAVSEFEPRVFFDLAGHAGVAIASNSQLFELVPIARIRFMAKERLGLYGDSGIGISIAHASSARDAFGNTVGGNTSVGAILRFAGGLQYLVSPSMALAFEPLGLNVYIDGNGSTFAYSLLFGLLFKV